MKDSIILILFPLISFSCQETVPLPNSYDEITIIENGVSYTWDSSAYNFTLPDGISSSDYYFRTLFQYNTGDTCLIFIYYSGQDKIDVFDPTQKQYLYSIPLPAEYNLRSSANYKKSFISSIFVHNLDSIFLLTTETKNSIILTNSKGENQREYSLNRPELNIYFRNHSSFPIYFDANTNSIFLHGFYSGATSYSMIFFNEAI